MSQAGQTDPPLSSETTTTTTTITTTTIPLVVVGAHLSGFPLNRDLTSRGGFLVESTTTSATYRLYSLSSSGSSIRKPGLKRVHQQQQQQQQQEKGHQIQVEVWRLPTSEFAGFFLTIPHPLDLGSVELRDGSWFPGFICEPVGLLPPGAARDITEFGGWRAFIESSVE